MYDILFKLSARGDTEGAESIGFKRFEGLEKKFLTNQSVSDILTEHLRKVASVKKVMKVKKT